MIEIIDRIIDEKIEVNRVEQRREKKRRPKKGRRMEEKYLYTHIRKKVKIKKY